MYTVHRETEYDGLFQYSCSTPARFITGSWRELTQGKDVNVDILPSQQSEGEQVGVVDTGAQALHIPYELPQHEGCQNLIVHWIRHKLSQSLIEKISTSKIPIVTRTPMNVKSFHVEGKSLLQINRDSVIHKMSPTTINYDITIAVP